MESFAKIFKNGSSQAVRLPKEFRFECDRVRIKKEGRKVILEPDENTVWPAGFWEMFTRDTDFEVPKPLPSRPLDLDHL